MYNDKIESTASTLYEAYCMAVGGDPLPSWAEFGSDPNKQLQANGWRVVAQKAIESRPNFAIPISSETLEIMGFRHDLSGGNSWKYKPVESDGYEFVLIPDSKGDFYNSLGAVETAHDLMGNFIRHCRTLPIGLQNDAISDLSLKIESISR